MKITLVIEDTAEGAVRIKKTSQPGIGESAQTVTPASVLAEEMITFAESFGEGTEQQDTESRHPALVS